MKPRNKFEWEIMDLSFRFTNPITDDQLQFGQSNKVHFNYYTRYRMSCYCLECGAKFKSDPHKKKCTCLSCHRKLEHTDKKSISEYFGIYDIVKGVQVHRIFLSVKNLTKGSQPTFTITEVMQFWITEEGKYSFVSLDTYAFTQCYDNYIFISELSIKDRSSNRANLIHVTCNYPKKKILPILKRNGFVPDKVKYHPAKIMEACIKCEFVEFLMKHKKYNLVHTYMQFYIEKQNHIRTFKNQFRIVFKHGYKISDLSDYIDYLDLLVHFGKDINSPHYLCPPDFKQAHAKYVAKKSAIAKKIKLEHQLQQLKDDDEKYVSEKSRYFDFAINEDDILITVPKSVEDFRYAGDKLKHCIFTNEYYKKQSLVLFAYVNDELIETAELNLETRDILQSRGCDNQPSEYNELIVQKISNNIHKLISI